MLTSYQEGSIWRASRITEVGDAPRMGGRKASLRGSKTGSPRMEVESCPGRPGTMSPEKTGGEARS